MGGLCDFSVAAAVRIVIRQRQARVESKKGV